MRGRERRRGAGRWRVGEARRAAQETRRLLLAVDGGRQALRAARRKAL